jgi:hypothetical protein
MDLPLFSLRLSFLGLAAVCVGAPIASWLVLRRRHRAARAAGAPLLHPKRPIIAVLLAWCALSIAASWSWMYIGFWYAWMSAHPPRYGPLRYPPAGGPLGLLFMCLGIPLLMAGFALVFHSFIARRYTASRRV